MTKPLHTLGISFCGLACLTWLVPLQALAADANGARPPMAAKRTAIRDVALGANGSINGQLLDAQGRARANQVVVVVRQGAEALKAQSRGRIELSVPRPIFPHYWPVRVQIAPRATPELPPAPIPEPR